MYVIAQNNETVYIRSLKFATPLLEKWIAEYSKSNPDVQIAIADGKDVNVKDADIYLVASESHKTNVFSVGSYAILPVAGKDNVLLSHLRKKRLNEKRLKELFFEKDIIPGETPEKDKYTDVTVYSANSYSPVSGTFAGYFGYEISDIRGKKIAGDDIYLISAIQKDSTGVCFNNLSYIYDVSSRQLKENIAILPLDLKKEYGEIVAEADLDELIALLENHSIDLIPVKDFSFTLSGSADEQAHHFVHWVLSEGQAFNHQFGFLKQQNTTLAINLPVK
jgi:ABC-type phosphate transport system substrate-binding protein